MSGINFQDTFTIAVKLPTIRIILSMAIINHLCIRQLGVKNANLHGFLEENVFTEQPPSFVNANVC